MRNKILTLTRSSIPYVKELRPITKSIAGAIVMQQLDYLFNLKPEGFYKFLEPCPHELYRTGDSWCEEIGCTPDEFRAAFDKIGIRYRSKTDYAQAGEDKFQGMLYCSYYDKVKGETWYFRNHERVDQLLDELITADAQKADPGKWKKPSPVDGKSHLQRSEKPSTIEMEKPISVDGKTHLESLAKTTTKNPKDNNKDTEAIVVASAATLLQSLMAENIPKTVAQKLIHHYGEEAVLQQLEWLPDRKHNPERGNRGGLLRKAIEEEWGMPAAKRVLPRPKLRASIHKPVERSSEIETKDIAAMRTMIGSVRQKTRIGTGEQ